MNNYNIKKTWIERLAASTDATQTTDFLCKVENNGKCTYCAMGLLAEILVEAKYLDCVVETLSNGNVVKRYIDVSDGQRTPFEEEMIPRNLLHRIYIPSSLQNSVVSLNDNKCASFNEIKKMLLEDYPEVFVE
jgi:hypothetical protein